MVCMDESLCCSPETITALLIGYQSVQSLSLIQLFTTPWTSVCQASLSITNSWGLLKLMSIEWVLPSNYLVLCHPILLLPSVFPSITVFSTESVLRSGGQSIGASASTSVLPINIQNWFPLGLTGLISLQSKGLSRVFSNLTFQRHQFFGAQLSLWSSSHIHDHMTTGKAVDRRFLDGFCLWLDRPLLAK